MLRWEERMEEEHLAPEIRIYNAILDAFGRAGDFDNMLLYFEEMKKRRILPDVTTYNKILGAFGHRGDIKNVEKFLEVTYLSPSDVIVIMIFISWFRFHPFKPFSLVSYILQDMKANKVQPNFETYCNLIEGYGRAKNFDRVLECWIHIKELSLTTGKKIPREDFLAIIEACGQNGRVDLVYSILSQMKEVIIDCWY